MADAADVGQDVPLLASEKYRQLRGFAGPMQSAKQLTADTSAGCNTAASIVRQPQNRCTCVLHALCLLTAIHQISCSTGRHPHDHHVWPHLGSAVCLCAATSPSLLLGQDPCCASTCLAIQRWAVSCCTCIHQFPCRPSSLPTSAIK